MAVSVPANKGQSERGVRLGRSEASRIARGTMGVLGRCQALSSKVLL